MTTKVERPNKVYELVIWNDAHSNSSNDVTEATMTHEPLVYQTYGWVLKSDPVGITIAAEWCTADETYRSTTFIPRLMVIEEIPMRLSRHVKREKHEPKQAAVAL